MRTLINHSVEACDYFFNEILTNAEYLGDIYWSMSNALGFSPQYRLIQVD